MENIRLGCLGRCIDRPMRSEMGGGGKAIVEGDSILRPKVSDLRQEMKIETLF